jgi:hypothetical protein
MLASDIDDGLIFLGFCLILMSPIIIAACRMPGRAVWSFLGLDPPEDSNLADRVAELERRVGVKGDEREEV